MPEVTQKEFESLAGHRGSEHCAEVPSPQLLHSHQVGPKEAPHVQHAEQSPKLRLKGTRKSELNYQQGKPTVPGL